MWALAGEHKKRIEDVLINKLTDEQVLDQEAKELENKIHKIQIQKKLVQEKFSPVNELGYMRGLYDHNWDYLTLDLQHGILRNYYHILANIRMMRKKLDKKEYIKMPSLSDLYHKTEQSFKIGEPTYLTGETWWGKTEFAITFAREKTGKEPILIPCTSDTGKSELVAKQKFENIWWAIKITDVYEWLQKWAKEGRIVILDEANKLSDEQKWTLNHYLSLCGKRWTTQTTQMNGWEEFSVAQEYYVIMTGNEWDHYETGSRVSQKFEASIQRRIYSQEYPYMQSREMAYIFLGMLWERDRIEWYTGIDRHITSFIRWYDDLQKLFTNNFYEQDEEIKSFIYKIPAPDIGKLKKICERYNDDHISLQYHIRSDYINQNKDLAIKLYLFSVFQKSWLFDINIVNPNTDIPQILNNGVDNKQRLTDIEKIGAYMDSLKKLPVNKTQIDKVNFLANNFHPELKDKKDELWDAFSEDKKSDDTKKTDAPKKTIKNLWVLEAEVQEHKEINMTAKDKENKQKAINFIKSKPELNTPANLAMLDKIIYHKDSIEIGWVKRAREDIKAEPDNKKIFQHGDTTYFQRREKMIKKQNKLLAKQGMEIPWEKHYNKSLNALPVQYSLKWEWYNGLNILAIITDMSMSGYCKSGGKLDDEGTYGYRWLAFPEDLNSVEYFEFNEDKAWLNWNNSSNVSNDAMPIRPVFK